MFHFLDKISYLDLSEAGRHPLNFFKETHTRVETKSTAVPDKYNGVAIMNSLKNKSTRKKLLGMLQ